MKSIKTFALLIAPALVLGGFAFYAGRAPKTKPKSAAVEYGPFSMKVMGVEAVAVKPIDVYSGYDRHFDIVLQSQGTRPKWWGTPIGSRSGTELKDWKFFLEREGAITPFKPGKAQAWTSGWDDKRKRYTNELFLHCGDVPTDSALKVRGVTELKADNTVVSAPLSFEITLKRAGQQWTKPVFSTDPGLTVRKITVKRNAASEREATIEVVQSKPGNAANWQRGAKFLDAKWRPFIQRERREGRWKGAHTVINSGFGGGTEMPLDRSVLQYQLSWNEADMKYQPLRDVIAVAHVSTDGRWPLEIAFWAKQDGQQTLGEVPPLTRPKLKEIFGLPLG